MDSLIGRVLAIGASTDDAHAGMLDQSDYNHFWATLCDQDAATQFMAASLDKLVTLRVRFHPVSGVHFKKLRHFACFVNNFIAIFLEMLPQVCGDAAKFTS
jgi:hypothetical protein